jgi:hypothetical protein
MKKPLFLALLVPFFCSGNLFAAALPAATGQDVINYLNEVNYRSWQLWPGKAELYKGTHPHGALLTTYVSKGAYRAVENKTGSIPTGEFVVKENYTPDKKLAAVTVMYKQTGYNAEAGDWFWLKYGPDGSIQKEGKVSGCIGCHAAVKSNDWLFIGPVK